MFYYKHHSANIPELFFFSFAPIIHRCTWGPSSTTTPPRMTSSRAKRQAWSFRPVTSSTSSTSRIPTGGRAEWRAALLTSQGWFPPQSCRNGKQLCHAAWWPVPQHKREWHIVPTCSRPDLTVLLPAGGLPVSARRERAVSPAARSARRRSAKTSTWPSTAPVSAPPGSCFLDIPSGGLFVLNCLPFIFCSFRPAGCDFLWGGCSAPCFLKENPGAHR